MGTIYKFGGTIYTFGGDYLYKSQGISLGNIPFTQKFSNNCVTGIQKPASLEQ